MIGVLVSALCALAVLCGWVAGASYLYCRLSGHADMFVYPFDQWFYALAYWYVNHWTRLDILISAAAPLALVAAAAWSIRTRRAAAVAKLYGESEFANRSEMEKGGIKTNRRAF